jgi:hypothetical protein
MNRLLVISIDEEFEKSRVRQHTRRRKGRIQMVESYQKEELAGQKRHFKPGGKITRAGRKDPKEKKSKVKIYSENEIKEFEKKYSGAEKMIPRKDEFEKRVILQSQTPVNSKIKYNPNL